MSQAVDEKIIVYFSGKITDNPSFKSDFSKAIGTVHAEYAAKDIEMVPLDPTSLPDGLSYGSYLDIDLAMVRACDMVVALPNYKGSPGARAEVALAECLKKEIKYL